MHHHAPESQNATDLRALTLIYHEDFEAEITAIVKQEMAVARYTKIRDVVGARADFLRAGNYQPPDGRNHMLIIVAESAIIGKLANDLRALRRKHGHGVRGYVTPVEEVI